MVQPKIEGPEYGKPIMPYGSDGTNWIAVLVDALGHLQVDVVSAALGSGGATEATLLLIKGYVDALETLLAGGLPAALDSGALKTKEQSPLTGFATSANQTTMITALQLIDDLRAALGSVNTDDLQVDVKTYPGVNALGNFPFGYYDRYAEQAKNLNASADANNLLGTAVPVGEIWVVRAINAYNVNTNPTLVVISALTGGYYIQLIRAGTPGANTRVNVLCDIVMKAGDQLVAYFTGCVAGDDIYLEACGYKMKIA